MRILIIGLLAVIAVAAQNVGMASRDDLIADSIPKVPASVATAALKYQNSFSDSFLGWGLKRTEMFVVRKRPEAWFVGAVESPGSMPRFLAFVPGNCYGTSLHPQGKSLIFRVDDTSGAELTQLYHYDIETRTSALLTDGVSRNLYPIWSNSGEWLIYSSSRRTGKDLDIYTVKPSDPKITRIVAQLNGEDWAVFDWSPDDRKVIISDYRSINESYLWVLDVETGEKVMITPPKKGEKIFNGSCAQFSSDGKGIYHITDRESEFRRLAYLDIETGRYTYLSNDIRWDIEEFVLSPDRRSLAFLANEEGISRLHVLDTTTNKEYQMPDLPIGVISELRWDSTGKYLGFALSAAATPGDVYGLDVKARKLQRWTSSYTGDVRTEAIPEPELIKWPSFDGRSISGFLYKPQTPNGRHPVLINIHGGPDSQDRPGFRGEDNYFTCELGIALIYPNIRGSAGYGKNYLKLDNGVRRGDSYKDIGALLDWIKSQPALDSERVMVRGESSGGNAALAIASNYGERIRGAISISGPTSLLTLMQTLDRWQQERAREEYGDARYARMRHYLESIAPLTNIKRIKTPLFIIHGKLDTRVPVSEAEQLINAARRQGVRVWSLLLKNEGHGFADPQSKHVVFTSQILFVQQHLLEP